MLPRFTAIDLLRDCCHGWRECNETPEKIKKMFPGGFDQEITALDLVRFDFLPTRDKIEACSSVECVLGSRLRHKFMSNLAREQLSPVVLEVPPKILAVMISCNCLGTSAGPAMGSKLNSMAIGQPDRVRRIASIYAMRTEVDDISLLLRFVRACITHDGPSTEDILTRGLIKLDN